jgi:hypothetical protein
MPSDKPRLNICATPRLRGDLERVSQQRDQSVSEIARAAIRKEIRKDFPTINRAAMSRDKEGS